jgi:hypothetical protein
MRARKVQGLGVDKRKKCTSKQRKVIRFLKWSGQAVGVVKLGMWEVVGCVGSLRCPLETRGVGCGQDRVRRRGGSPKKGQGHINHRWGGAAIYASKGVNVGEILNALFYWENIEEVYSTNLSPLA